MILMNYYSGFSSELQIYLLFSPIANVRADIPPIRFFFPTPS